MSYLHYLKNMSSDWANFSSHYFANGWPQEVCTLQPNLNRARNRILSLRYETCVKTFPFPDQSKGSYLFVFLGESESVVFRHVRPQNHHSLVLAKPRRALGLLLILNGGGESCPGRGRGVILRPEPGFEEWTWKFKSLGFRRGDSVGKEERFGGSEGNLMGELGKK